jgi:hypothetical protein
VRPTELRKASLSAVSARTFSRASKNLLAALVGFGIATFGQPANAFVAEVATSIAAATVGDDEQLQDAISSAVTDVLRRAIAFTPSVVQLQEVKLVGDRIYLLLLIADPDGEETLKAFAADQPTY